VKFPRAFAAECDAADRRLCVRGDCPVLLALFVDRVGLPGFDRNSSSR
jgi:hypothetical protein